MRDDQFPSVTDLAQMFFRDAFFLNYHINHDKWDWFRFQDVIDCFRVVDDFWFWDADHYVITTTEAGSSNATEDIGDIPGGVLVVTNDNADNDSDEIVTEGEVFKFAKGYPLYFEVRGKVSDPLESDFWAGLLNSVSYFGGNALEGAYFLKEDDSLDLQFVVMTGGAEKKVDTGVDAEKLTWRRIGFHWDGVDTIRWFVFYDGDGPQTLRASGKVTALPSQTEEMNAGFGIRNGEAESKILYVDYMKAVQKRITGDASHE